MDLTKNIYAVADGEIYPKNYSKGEKCPDNLLNVARSLGALANDLEGKAFRKSPEKKVSKNDKRDSQNSN